ncbi:MFS general substrate transporter [Rhizoclosmatium globosum]|uniref:MFS general substrate transporter n=1 Tax=Rhizoclosmatium globosum TaxID=329046 RepID=A0A1Y2AMH6_9FUNG|nr:MFS general substrate transporter [Rhizoclosmatium globosum]|eukprot:ORY23761.1 MFS general substrate transporter [Rhizoclosmatium globosum]
MKAMVASALKSITIALGEYGYLPYVGTAYALSMVPSLLIYDRCCNYWKLSRKWSFILAIGIFEVGSLVCGLAQNMHVIIVGRTLAGFGAGGLILLFTTLSSQIVSYQDGVILFMKTESTFEGFAGIILFISAILSPTLGGLFSDKLSWRWCFYIEIVLGVIPTIIILRYLNIPYTKDDTTIDVLGVSLLFASLTFLIIPLQLYQISWDWKSPQSVTMYVVSVVLFLAFIYVEWNAAEPILPHAIFENSTIPALLMVAFCVGAAFVGTIWNVALFFQLNFDDNQILAGAYIVPAFIGLLIGSSVSRKIVDRFETFIPSFYAGPIIAAAGTILLAFLHRDSKIVERVMYLFVFGFGDGIIHIIRNRALRTASPADLSFRYTMIAVACLLIGSAFSITISGTILKSVFAHRVAESDSIQEAMAYLRSLEIQVDTNEIFHILEQFDIQSLKDHNSVVDFGKAGEEILYAYNSAFRISMFSLLPFSILMMLMAPFIKVTPIEK